MTHHGHTHSGTCPHHPVPTQFHGAFAIGIALNVIFVAIEFFFGWWAESLALVADAAHNLGDVLALAVAWLGYALMKHTTHADSRFTLGLGRVSIYAAIFNGITLVVSSVWILYEAFERLHDTPSPMPFVIALVALAGVVINGFTAWLLAKGQNDLNIRGAMLHMAADALISVGVVVAALLLAFTGWVWLDPAVSVIISLIILWGAWPLLRESTALALDAVPSHIDRAAIKVYLATHPMVESFDNLHIWPISTSQTALSVHIRTKQGAMAAPLLEALHTSLKNEFNINMITIQID